MPLNARAAEHLLASPLVSTLIGAHPNALAAASAAAPPQFAAWWDWAAADPPGDDALLHYAYDDPGPQDATDIPRALRDLIADARRLQLDRRPATFPTAHPAAVPAAKPGRGSPWSGQAHGMNPKKAHEVARMVDYIAALLAASPRLRKIKHVVDVGAGQGYLSRALRDHLHLHVLALDADPHQTAGAERRRARDAARAPPHPHHSTDSGGSLTHATVHITPRTLRDAVDAWLRAAPGGSPGNAGGDDEEGPVPVLVVALHACGSLTPSILRAVLDVHREGEGRATVWTPAAAVVVGCCYNMMDPADFPLSSTLRTSAPVPSPMPAPAPAPSSSSKPPTASTPAPAPTPLALTPNHLQLAAQVPAEWLRTPQARADAARATRKVVWRALLERVLADDGGTGETGACEGAGDVDVDVAADGGAGRCADGGRGKPRLGRLNDAVYDDWGVFVRVARARLGRGVSGGDGNGDGAGGEGPRRPGEIGSGVEEDARRDEDARAALAMTERRLAVVHVLRCLLGPVIESLIIRDRQLWLQEQLSAPAPIATTPAAEPARNPSRGLDGRAELGGDSARPSAAAHGHGDTRETPPPAPALVVRLVNLFDQASGSGRNVALVLAPGDALALESGPGPADPSAHA